MLSRFFLWTTTARVGARSLALAVCLVQAAFFLRAPFVVTPMAPWCSSHSHNTRAWRLMHRVPAQAGKILFFFGSDRVRTFCGVWYGWGTIAQPTSIPYPPRLLTDPASRLPAVRTRPPPLWSRLG